MVDAISDASLSPEERKQAHRRHMKRLETRRYNERLRRQVFDHYGWICACCGTAEWLSIDHVNGDGMAHRLELFGRQTSSKQMYRWLIINNFPEGFQTLCVPCNNSKHQGERCRLDHISTLEYRRAAVLASLENERRAIDRQRREIDARHW